MKVEEHLRHFATTFVAATDEERAALSPAMRLAGALATLALYCDDASLTDEPVLECEEQRAVPPAAQHALHAAGWRRIEPNDRPWQRVPLWWSQIGYQREDDSPEMR